MKHVYSTSHEVAHKWAQQSPDLTDARCRNMFADGASIYSYGRHFEIARSIDADTVLITTRGYSVTTSKHISDVANAVSNRAAFRVPSFTDHKANAEYFIAEIEKRRAQCVRARTNAEWRKSSLNGFISDAFNYSTCELFRKHIPIALRRRIAAFHTACENDTLFSADEVNKIKKANAAAAVIARNRTAAQNAARAARDAEYARKRAERVAKWLDGSSDDIPQYGDDGFTAGTLLRIKGKRIETSRGAAITLRAAVELWQSLTGAPGAAALIGMDLDGYPVNGWDGAVLTVGCHKIPAGELLKLAAVLHLSGTLLGPITSLTAAAGE